MKRIAVGLVLLALGPARPAVAADPAPGAALPAPPLTLDEAGATALEQNPLLRAADAGVGAAEAQLDEARSYRLPRTQLSEFASRSTNPVMVFSDLLTQERFGPANFDPAFLNEPPPTNNWNTKLAVMQPIWTGGKIAGGVAAAEMGAAAAAADRDSARQQVSEKVIEAYSGAVLAESYRRVAGEALETARAHVKLVKDMVETGMVVRSDLLQAEVKELEAKDMLIRAESQAAVARAGLNMAMGRPLGTPATLPETVDIPTLTERDLDARAMSPAWRAVMFEMAARTRALFDAGRAVADGLDGRLRYELRLTWLGGMRVLERLERSGFDVFTSRPTLGAADVPALAWGALAWSGPRAA
jgi:outer membrane protein TolC